MTATIALALCAWLATALPLESRAHAKDQPDVAHSTPRWARTSDPNLYERSLGTEVLYDQQLTERTYDDGYGPHAHLQFEAELAAHGTWVDTSELGRVWIPSRDETGPDFWPYGTGGHWVLTEYGWTWSSDWKWGWIPFHFGRWAMLPDRGWCWVPGTLWGPAWVAWRLGKRYVAWAPLPPRGMNLARPIGTSSPWWMALARTLGPAAELVPRREVPALFSLTTALSNPKELAVASGVGARINLGPPSRTCCGRRLRAAKLAEAAPGAAPAFVVEPRPGAPLDDRPWVRSGFLDQAPLSHWPNAARAAASSHFDLHSN
jgi:hypothetical protein